MTTRISTLFNPSIYCRHLCRHRRRRCQRVSSSSSSSSSSSLFFILVCFLHLMFYSSTLKNKDPKWQTHSKSVLIFHRIYIDTLQWLNRLMIWHWNCCNLRLCLEKKIVSACRSPLFLRVWVRSFGFPLCVMCIQKKTQMTGLCAPTDVRARSLRHQKYSFSGVRSQRKNDALPMRK